MRIVLIGQYNDSEILTGPEKVAKRLFQFLPREGNEIYFLTYFFKNSKDHRNYLNRLIGYQNVSGNKFILKMGILRIFYFLITVQPEIIHIVTSERFIIPMFFYRFLLKGKIIITKHSIVKYEIQSKKKGRYKDFIQEYLEFKICDHIFFLSDAHITLASKYYELSFKDYSIVPNGIDNIFYNSISRRNIEGKINILFYNGMNDSLDRGIEFVIEALNECKHVNKLELFIIGKWNYKYSIPKFNFYLVDLMSGTYYQQFLQDKHLIIKSITVDSFSIVVAECMSMGIVPIISENVGIKRYIIHNENGFIYTNKYELTQILNELLDAPERIEKLSMKAIDIYKELKWDKVIERYQRKYLELLKNE